MGNEVSTIVNRLRNAGYEVTPPIIARLGALGFPQRLKMLRERHNLSLQQLADTIGMSKAYVWELEKDRTGDMSALTLFKLAKVYKMDATELYFGFKGATQ
ncbi:MAG: hypothetical protein COA43_01220 [Robiginitomaculum sp.]|nr:MAG: hypothetical protein COA43_01220 [Robiginitomaculum sp.]